MSSTSTAPSSARPQLTLSLATPANIPRIAHIHAHAFSSDPQFNALFPLGPTPVQIAWHTERHGEALASDRRARIVKAVRDDTGEIVAYGKWIVPPPEGEEEEKKADAPAVPWPEEANIPLWEEFKKGLKESQERIMKGRRHYFLQILATDPAHQGTGAGSRILRWGLDQADAEGLPTYIEATPMGLPIYKRFGWEEAGEIRIGEGGRFRTVVLVREPPKGTTA